MKLGLALSGGGFRASFFHIGVLARMAEIGKLSQVEVISTVSGGSIIGAMYYVKLKKLLDGNASPSNEQIVKLVEEIEKEFLAGVQTNIRMRTFSNPIKNLHMSLANYSRSDRLAELYDKVFYHPVLSPGNSQMIKMKDLKIAPGSVPQHPNVFNASVAAGGCKLPIILINASSLNSGHNWRFEASRMGEPERSSEQMMVIDKNSRFSRPDSYDVMPKGVGDIRLGHAVAASACVPGLFNPLAISNLYEEARIQLVDGGVHDNQGVEALLEHECDEIIISDASGQMGDEMEPSAHIPQVVGRSNSVLMDRVREEELKEVLHNSNIRTTLLHLRKGLVPETIPYIGEQQQHAQPAHSSLAYGVHHDIQDAISKIRTDLDSFSDIEADTLMADGYLMSTHSFDNVRPIKDGDWSFSYLLDKMKSNDNKKLMQHLDVANKQFLKVFLLRPVISSSIALGMLAVLVALVWVLFGQNIQSWWTQPLQSTTYGELVTYIGVAILLSIVSVILSRWKRLYTLYKNIRRPVTFVGRLLVRGLPPMVGSVFIWIHLAIFDRMFLKEGKRENFTSADMSSDIS
jgi:NTE family protein